MEREENLCKRKKVIWEKPDSTTDDGSAESGSVPLENLGNKGLGKKGEGTKDLGPRGGEKEVKAKGV